MRRLTVLFFAIALLLGISFISITSQASRYGYKPIDTAVAVEKASKASFSAVENSQYNVRSAQQEFNIREAFVDELNMVHIRMDQSHAGLKVFQGELITHFNADGSLSTISGEYYKDINISTTPKLTIPEAINVATQDFGHILSAEPTVELMVLPQDGKYHLAYRVEVADIQSNHPAAHVYFVSAKSGKILFDYDNLETAASLGTGKSLYSGNVSLATNSLTSGFEMRDTTRGGTYTTNLNKKTSGNGTIFTDADNIWGNNTNADAASAGVDAHYGVQITFDYYKNVHGRNGIANNGAGSFNRVHYGRNYNNAYWSDSCFCMTYGDGDGSTFSPLTSIDVAGHEMSHGVTSRTANLTYSGQSGGLNEATSDIFGTCVEFYSNNANDPGDYLIGERITLRRLATADPNTSGGKYLRSMAHPTYDGASVDNFSKYTSGLDVHYSSGIANNFFYLLSEGGTNDTSKLTVTGISRAKAEKIWYRALTVYMTSGTTFAQARTATLNAAADLYGASSAERTAVANAWTACGVN